MPLSQIEPNDQFANLVSFYRLSSSECECNFYVYLEALNHIKKSKFPIYGIVETSVSAPYIKNLLYSYKTKGVISDKDFTSPFTNSAPNSTALLFNAP